MTKDDIIKGLNGYDPWKNSEGYVYRPELAEKALRFAREVCCHVSGLSGPLILAPWQEAHTRTLLGWVDKETGFRRYLSSNIWCARKNGKSLYAAFLAWYFLGLDNEPGAQVLLGAGSRDQSKHVFNAMVGMYNKQPILQKHFEVIEGKGTIRHAKSNSYLQTIPHSGSRNLGANCSFGILDEVAFYADNSTLIESIRSSSGVRRSPCLLCLSTAGFSRSGPGWQEFQRSQRVKAESNDPTHLPVIYQRDSSLDWSSEAAFASANPTYSTGYPRKSFFVAKRNEALAFPSMENDYRRFYLNEWTEVSTRFFKHEDIQSIIVDNVDLSGAKLVSCAADFSSSVDTTCLVLLYKLKNGKLYCKGYTWISEQIERQSTMANWKVWKHDPRCNITVIPGEVIDKNVVVADITNLHKKIKLPPIYYDRSYGVQAIKDLMQANIKTVAFNQSPTYFSAPTRETERLIKTGELIFDGDPCLKFQLENMEIKTYDAGLVRPIHISRQHVNDMCVALVMAVQGYLVGQRAQFTPFSFGSE